VAAVSEVPESLRRLNILLEAMFIAHETIYDLHSDLVRADRATPISKELLAESARVLLQSALKASVGTRRLAAKWHEQSVLDPEAAEDTALKLDTEFAYAEPTLRELLARETAIAAKLRALATDSR
jgi:hypothetical protein